MGDGDHVGTVIFGNNNPNIRQFGVRRALNGIIVKDEDGEESVFQDTDNGDEIEMWRYFLCFLTERYGPQDMDKYSEKRIYISIAPGDKWEGELGECPLRDFIECPYIEESPNY